MKKLYPFFIVLCAAALVASSVVAADDQLATRDGVRVTVQLDPFGPNNLIVANVKFVNENRYKVAVSWWPVITCGRGDKREGSIGGFSMNEGETYVVNIWRSSACGQGQIEDFEVKMDVKKANP